MKIFKTTITFTRKAYLYWLNIHYKALQTNFNKLKLLLKTLIMDQKKKPLLALILQTTLARWLQNSLESPFLPFIEF